MELNSLFRIFDGRLATSVVGRLAKAERHIPVLDHMVDLALHRNEEEHNEIQQQDGPEHRHVEYTKEGHADRDQHRPRARVPELELRQSSGERSDVIKKKEWH